MRAPLLTLTLMALSTASVHGAELPPRHTPEDVASPTAGVSERARAPIQSLSEEDAREWLARYARAWGSRDVAALSELGIIRPEQRPETRRQLAAYQQYDVSVSNESISLEGTRARMSFDRVDTDETGRQLRHPRQTVVLERLPQGVVSTWRGGTEQ